MQLLVRALRLPRALVLRVYDAYWVPAMLRLQGIQVGSGCRFAGMPIIRAGSAGQIILGKGVLLASRAGANVAGIAHPTILSAAEGGRIEVGNDTGISGASIVARTGISIGARVLIGAGACIWDTDFHPLQPGLRREHPTRDARSAPITIENDVFIGGRAIVLKGVRIGRGAVVAAGAVVTSDVAPESIVAGNPARPVRPPDERPGP